jgi:glycosyltransferase involved in cell wall biosynthesis
VKPRIIIILNRLVVGGQSIDTIPLAASLTEEYDIMIIHGQKEKDEEDYTIDDTNTTGLSFTKIPALKRSINPLHDIRAFLTLYRIIKKYAPSIVHTHGSKPGLTGRLAAWMAGTPVIIHTFHGHLFHSYYNSIISVGIIRFERLLAKITNKLIVLSTKQQREITEQYAIVSPKKTVLIPLGVPDFLTIENAAYLRNTARDYYNIATDCVAIAVIGRMVPVKNYSLFVEIITGLLPKVQQPVKFFFIGDGEQKLALQQQLNSAGIFWCNGNSDLKAQVIFTSWVSPVTVVLHGMDIITLTSLNEGTPLSLIEAQMCAKPVVAANAGGVADTFADGVSGFLIDGYDSDAYMKKLLMLIENESMRISMGQKGYNFAKNKFSRQNEVDAFKNLYAGCISASHKNNK